MEGYELRYYATFSRGFSVVSAKSLGMVFMSFESLVRLTRTFLAVRFVDFWPPPRLIGSLFHQVSPFFQSHARLIRAPALISGMFLFASTCDFLPPNGTRHMLYHGFRKFSLIFPHCSVYHGYVLYIYSLSTSQFCSCTLSKHGPKHFVFNNVHYNGDTERTSKGLHKNTYTILWEWWPLLRRTFTVVLLWYGVYTCGCMVNQTWFT